MIEMPFAALLGLVFIICSPLNPCSLIFVWSEKTDWNCLLRISAFCLGSVKRQPLTLSPGIVELSFFLCLI